jgi:Phage holin family Hol44, in holin superfamily V
MNLEQFIVEEALYVIPVLWILGFILKKTPSIADWIIPYILLIVGMGLTLWTLGLNPQAVAQGFLVTGAAVLGHQLVQQAKYKEG